MSEKAKAHAEIVAVEEAFNRMLGRILAAIDANTEGLQHFNEELRARNSAWATDAAKHRERMDRLWYEEDRARSGRDDSLAESFERFERAQDRSQRQIMRDIADLSRRTAPPEDPGRLRMAPLYPDTHGGWTCVQPFNVFRERG